MKPLLPICCLVLALAGWTVGRRLRGPAAAPVREVAALAPAPKPVAVPVAKAAPLGVDALLAFLTEHPGQAFPVDFFANGLADPAACGRALLELGDAGKTALRDAARRIALTSPRALEAFVKTAGESRLDRNKITEDALVWAFCRKPEAGLLALATLKHADEAVICVEKMLRAFPPKDLPTVRVWYDQLPEGRLKTAALRELFPVLARQNYAEALAFTSTISETPSFGGWDRANYQFDLVYRFGPDHTWKGQDELIAQLPKEDQAAVRKVAQYSRFRELSGCQPEIAAQMLPELAEEYRDMAAGTLFFNWGSEDPVRAAQSLNALPDTVKTPELLESFAERWAGQNVNQASTWLDGLPEGQGKNAAITGIAKGLCRKFPAEAVTWAGSLSSPEQRLAALGGVVAGAEEDAKPLVRQAIDSLPLSAVERASLLSPDSNPNPQQR